MRDIEDYTKNYLKPNFEDYQVKYRRKKIMEVINSYKPRRVLEIGCGMEPLFKYANEDQCLWTLVEPGELFCENAKKIAKMLNYEEHVFIYNESFPTKRIDNMQFDLIICSSLLHEIENSSYFLKEIANICMKDTIVHVNVPNANSFHRILAEKMEIVGDIHELSERNRRFQQYKVYDMKLFETEMKEAGFSICDSGSYFIKPFTHLQMYKMMELNIINDKVLEGLYIMADEFKKYGSEIYINAKLA